MNQKIKNHLITHSTSLGIEYSDDIVKYLLLEGKQIYKELIKEDWTIETYFIVVEIDGMNIGFNLTFDRIIGGLGELPYDSICEVIEAERIIKIYKPKNNNKL